MASKLLVDISNSTPTENRNVFYCVPCALNDESLKVETLEHRTVTGNEVCAACETKIADLPEPLEYTCAVELHITVKLDLVISSAAEALAWMKNSFKNQGIESIEWVWTADEKRFSGVWRLK